MTPAAGHRDAEPVAAEPAGVEPAVGEPAGVPAVVEPAVVEPPVAVLVAVRDPEEMRRLGAALGRRAEPGDLVVLSGPLGAGKTVLAQGLAAGLGARRPVTSPTFVISRVHTDGRIPFVHVDAYRLGSTVEVDDLDLDADLDRSVTAVEWGEGLVERLAPAHLLVEVDRSDDDVRRVRLSASGPGWARRLRESVVVADAVLFDLDGVLADSHAAVERHWREFADAHGLDRRAVLAGVHGRRSVDTVAALLPAEEVGAAALRLERRDADDTDGVVALPGAAALLAALPADRWAVVTSGSRPVATARLRACGLPVPAILVTAEDVERGKPDPQGYVLAAARLGVAPHRCVVVEDAPAGLAAGLSAGALTLGLTTTGAPGTLVGAALLAGDLTAVRVLPPSGGDTIRLGVDAGTPLDSGAPEA